MNSEWDNDCIRIRLRHHDCLALYRIMIDAGIELSRPFEPGADDTMIADVTATQEQFKHLSRRGIAVEYPPSP